MLETNVWTVALAALVTALATGLGAVPFWFVKSVSRWWLSISNAIAAGLMLGASHSLIAEGVGYSAIRVILGILVGLIFIATTHRLLEGREELRVRALREAGALKSYESSQQSAFSRMRAPITDFKISCRGLGVREY